MTAQHVVKIDAGNLGSVITDAMARLGAAGAPGGAPVKSGGGEGSGGATEKKQGELQAASENLGMDALFSPEFQSYICRRLCYSSSSESKYF